MAKLNLVNISHICLEFYQFSEMESSFLSHTQTHMRGCLQIEI
jgi:hypothetical protein